jgi:hydrogenase maturation protease
MSHPTKPILIFTWGNPSRGDDAIGPLIYDFLQQEISEDIEVITDFQLQIEHATDLENRDYVLFVDAGISTREPYEFYRLQAAHDDTYTTHAMSPISLLEVYRTVYKQEPPPAFMLSIRGYVFDLGLPVSAKANDNLISAMKFIRTLLSNSNGNWESRTNIPVHTPQSTTI